MNECYTVEEIEAAFEPEVGPGPIERAIERLTRPAIHPEVIVTYLSKWSGAIVIAKAKDIPIDAADPIVLIPEEIVIAWAADCVISGYDHSCIDWWKRKIDNYTKFGPTP